MRDEVNDFKLQGTIDIRIVNTIRRFFESTGANIRSVAELQRVSMQLLEDIAVQMGTPICEDTQEALSEMRDITYGKALFTNKRIMHTLNKENALVEAATEITNGWNKPNINRYAKILGIELPKEELPEEVRKQIEMRAQDAIEMLAEQEKNEQLSLQDIEYNNNVHKLMILKLEEYDRKIALAKTAKERRPLEETRSTIPRLANLAVENKRFFRQLAEV